MFSDYGKELLRSGIIEAKAGHRDVARRYLDRKHFALVDAHVDIHGERGEVVGHGSDRFA